MRAPVAGAAAPPLSGTTATGAAFDLADPTGRARLIEFHRGTW